VASILRASRSLITLIPIDGLKKKTQLAIPVPRSACAKMSLPTVQNGVKAMADVTQANNAATTTRAI
jgi:hypothetical protein